MKKKRHFGRVQTEMQEDLDHAAQLTDEYEVLRHDFEELQDAHEKVQVRGSLTLGVRSLVLSS